MPLTGAAALSACAGPGIVTMATAPKKAVPTVNKTSARDIDSDCIAVFVVVILLVVGCRLRVVVCAYGGGVVLARFRWSWGEGESRV